MATLQLWALCLLHPLLPLLAYARRSTQSSEALADGWAEGHGLLGGVMLLVKGSEERTAFLERNQEYLQAIPRSNVEHIMGTLPESVSADELSQWSNGLEGFVDETDTHNAKARAIWIGHSRVLDAIGKKALPGSPGDSIPYLVLEADQRLKSGWEEHFREVVSATPADWDVILMSYWGTRYCDDEVKDKDVFKVSGAGRSMSNWRRFAFYSGLQGYAVTPASARKLSALSKERPVRNIDRHFLHLAAEGQINEYASGLSHQITFDNEVYAPPYSRFLSCTTVVPW